MSSIGVMFAPFHQAAADELVRVCRPGGKIGLLCWTPEGMIGALFKVDGRLRGAAAARRIAAAEVGQRGVPAGAVRRPRRPPHRRARRTSTITAFERPARVGRALQGLLRADDHRPRERRAQRPRGGARRGARRVLRRVEPRARTTTPASSRSTSSRSARGADAPSTQIPTLRAWSAPCSPPRWRPSSCCPPSPRRRRSASSGSRAPPSPAASWIRSGSSPSTASSPRGRRRRRSRPARPPTRWPGSTRCTAGSPRPSRCGSCTSDPSTRPCGTDCSRIAA